MLYEKRFKAIHDFLKNYGCQAIFPDIHPEFQAAPMLGGIFFYQPLNSRGFNKEWEEVIDAKLDVVVPTFLSEVPTGKIRFDLERSERVKLYSMYISLPTHGESISLSRNRYKKSEDVIKEITKWLQQYKCKLVAKEVPVVKPEKSTEQLTLGW